MSAGDRRLARVRPEVHRSIPPEDRSTVNLRKDTVESITTVRNAINEAAGQKVVTNDDLIRLAFHSLGRISEISQSPEEAVTDHDEKVMLPVADVVHGTTVPTEWLPGVYPDDDDGGED